MTETVITRLETVGVVPVVEIEDLGTALPLADTLARAGLPVLEVTFRTAAAREAVEFIAAQLPAVLVGAGTLLTPAMVRTAVNAGASFGVSPGVDRAVLAAAAAQGLPFIPGVLTPSDVMLCLQSGLRHLKFFPASAFGGIGALSALAGPFASAGVRFMPTGGVTEETAAEYLTSPSVFAVGGTWIAPRDDIAGRRWAGIRSRARAAHALQMGLRP
jgi:2-dehydro-3-deoxyphosphogluconate aldolase/(4S)-4-hydroxy-2-oxoglutarate aldolase